MQKCDECGLGFCENGSRDVPLQKGNISLKMEVEMHLYKREVLGDRTRIFIMHVKCNVKGSCKLPGL
jgi:hypothetical protein